MRLVVVNLEANGIKLFRENRINNLVGGSNSVNDFSGDDDLANGKGVAPDRRPRS